MRIADVPEPAMEILKTGLDRFMSGLGRTRLGERGITIDHCNARGALSEAQFDPVDLDRLLSASGDALDALFGRLRVLLFDGERSIGSLGLLRSASGGYAIEHVSLGGAEQIAEGLAVAEELPGSATCEARLIRMPQIYLTALILVRNGLIDSFVVLDPPYSQGVNARTSSSFGRFVKGLLDEQRRIFPES